METGYFTNKIQKSSRFLGSMMPSRASFHLPILQPQFTSFVQRWPVCMVEKWLPTATSEMDFHVHSHGEKEKDALPTMEYKVSI